MACCPAHDDHHPSLSASEGKDGRVLLNCFAGCSIESVLAALSLTASDLFSAPSGPSVAGGSVKFQQSQETSSPQKPQQAKRSKQTWRTSREAIAALEKSRGARSAAWTYRDAAWLEVGVVLRWDRADGGKDILPLTKTVDGWQCGGMPDQRPLYRLGEISQSDVVYVVEGEKAADAGYSIGLNVTTSSGGGKAVEKSDWSPLAGKNVAIIPDNDAPGLEYAETVAGIVTQLDPPATVRILDLKDDWPELPDKGDLADWCDAHDSVEPKTLRERIEALASKAEPWIPHTVTQRSANTQMMRRAILQPFSEVEPETLRWLWPGRIPSGMLTVISGNPAGGKSFLMIDMVARVTKGTDWPDGSPAEEPGDVILVNVEDAVAIVQRPRLDAAGADTSRVMRIDGVELTTGDEVVESQTFCIMQAAEVLRSALEQLDRPRLVILDPLAAFLAGVRSNDQGDIRAALSPLVQLAEEFDVAIVFVHHNRKGTGSHASERMAGSLQIGATVRQSWEVVKDPEDENRRLFLPGKNSNAKDRGGLAFQIVDSDRPFSDDGDFVGKVDWQP
ncbi:MAG: AAA family ATPase, partial [Rhodopirellula sp.]|nr:AAA family ATPase [Rhodopirellula sp.]